jgi:ribosomal protein S12 methylthiotransferase
VNKRRKGRIERVLVERYDAERDVWIARSQADAPGIDGSVMVAAHPDLEAGRFAEVRFTRPSIYDMVAEVT